jgi:hydroxymethylglutaryl-CoA synthase
VGIGQEKMAIPPPDEDIVTMGASAAQPILQREGKDRIEMLLFATESGIDQSKAAGVFVHGLLQLPARCRTVELKEACYSGTAALQLAAAWVQAHPTSRVLVVAADVARYELGSPGEPTQGCGAVAMLVTAPAAHSGARSRGRPLHGRRHGFLAAQLPRPGAGGRQIFHPRVPAGVAGLLAAVPGAIRPRLADIHRFCYHLPFTRMAEKAHERLAKASGASPTDEQQEQQMGGTLRYNKRTGNSYAASLYVGLTCLLDTTARICPASASACSATAPAAWPSTSAACCSPATATTCSPPSHQQLLEQRTELTFQQYEDIYQSGLSNRRGSAYLFPLSHGSVPAGRAWITSRGQTSTNDCTRRPHESNCTG